MTAPAYDPSPIDCTTTTTELPVVHPIDAGPETLAYLAEPGHAEAVLATHYANRDGTCHGCGSVPRWSACWAVQDAHRAIAARRWAR